MLSIDSGAKMPPQRLADFPDQSTRGAMKTGVRSHPREPNYRNGEQNDSL